ncbi:MAG: GH3 auxin-responsive promoter family protein, partial [Burkholderiaceae bacterium]|nr:GH3 auxin-responsive promoter family protein [Burkholderiaceae bacterium]
MAINNNDVGMNRRFRVGVAFFTAVIATAVIGVLGSVFALRRLILTLKPEQLQQRLLTSILHRNSTSEYGRAHGFGVKLGSPSEFIDQHPIVDYEDLRSWVERSIECGRNLLAEVDLFRLSATSGTTGQPKVILQSRMLYRREYLEYTLAVLFRILLADPRSLMRPVGIIAAAGEHKRIGAVESASAANTLYRTSPFRRLAALPPTLFEIKNAGA